jgi:fibrillarin-like rRNA methylase
MQCNYFFIFIDIDILINNESIVCVCVCFQDEDGGTVEYREWDPYKSRLAAAILSGAKNIWIVSFRSFEIMYACMF